MLQKLQGKETGRKEPNNSDKCETKIVFYTDVFEFTLVKVFFKRKHFNDFSIIDYYVSMLYNLIAALCVPQNYAQVIIKLSLLQQYELVN